MTESWRLKVSDFGLSRFKDDSYSYMNPTSPFDVTITAPEVLEENHISEKADVYSFGLLLWEVLSGERPFGGKNPHWVAWTVIHNRIRPSLREEWDKPLCDLVSKCWQHDYTARPTFSEILKTLEGMHKKGMRISP